jgi:hypothetical protein
MKLPINFDQFSKDPVKGLLFITILTIGYLYVDNKMNYQDQIESCSVKVEKLTLKIEILEDKLRKSDSTLARAAARLEILNETGRIK